MFQAIWPGDPAHTIVDFVTIGVLQILGTDKVSSTLVVELIVAVFGVMALWIIWALRDRSTAAAETEIQPQSPVA